MFPKQLFVLLPRPGSVNTKKLDYCLTTIIALHALQALRRPVHSASDVQRRFPPACLTSNINTVSEYYECYDWIDSCYAGHVVILICMQGECSSPETHGRRGTVTMLVA